MYLLKLGMNAKKGSRWEISDFMKKRIATLEDHELGGKNLHNIRNGLMIIASDTTYAYGKVSVKGISDKLYQAQNIIDKVRSDLEERMFTENKPLDDDKIHVYYGHEDSNTEIYDIIKKHSDERNKGIDQEVKDKILAKYKK